MFPSRLSSLESLLHNSLDLLAQESRKKEALSLSVVCYDQLHILWTIGSVHFFCSDAIYEEVKEEGRLKNSSSSNSCISH